jgi:hypothetical protein
MKFVFSYNFLWATLDKIWSYFFSTPRSSTTSPLQPSIYLTYLSLHAGHLCKLPHHNFWQENYKRRGGGRGIFWIRTFAQLVPTHLVNLDQTTCDLGQPIVHHARTRTTPPNPNRKNVRLETLPLDPSLLPRLQLTPALLRHAPAPLDVSKRLHWPAAPLARPPIGHGHHPRSPIRL